MAEATLDILRNAVSLTTEVEINGKKITLALPQNLDPYIKMREVILGKIEFDDEGKPIDKVAEVGQRFKVAVIAFSSMVEGLDEGEAAAILVALGGEKAELTEKLIRLMGFELFFPSEDDDEGEEKPTDPS